MRFEPGRLVLHRHFVRDRIVWAPLTRVVSDDAGGLMLWMSAGLPVIREVTLDGKGPRGMPFAEWVDRPKHLIHDVWHGIRTLKLIRPGAAHAVWWFFGADGVFSGWYVNLEEPTTRWDDGAVAGVDGTDQDLDIWVYPDRTWEWKDDDELEERLQLPEHYWVSDGPAVWEEARRVIPLIEAGAYPFDGTWCDYRPEPGWAWPPDVPAGWDRPRAIG